MLSGRHTDYWAYGGRALDSSQVGIVQTSESRRSIATREMCIWSTGDSIFGICYFKRRPQDFPGEGESCPRLTETTRPDIPTGLPRPDQLLWQVHSEIVAGGSPLKPPAEKRCGNGKRLKRGELEFRKTTEHGNADALLRFPLENEGDVVNQLPTSATFSSDFLKTTVLTEEVQKATKKDPVLQEIIQKVHHGWNKADAANDWSSNYFRKRCELSMENGLLISGR